MNGARLKLGAEMRTNDAKITKKARITKKSKYKQPIFKKKNSTNNENIYFYHEKENILAYYWETQLLTESMGTNIGKCVGEKIWWAQNFCIAGTHEKQ